MGICDTGKARDATVFHDGTEFVLFASVLYGLKVAFEATFSKPFKCLFFKPSQYL